MLEFHLLPRSEGESEQILSRNPIKETDSIVTKVIVHVRVQRSVIIKQEVQCSIVFVFLITHCST